MLTGMVRIEKAEPVAAARAAFATLWHEPPAGVAFAPGRVTLIGEHTDYNDGFVLPMAIREGLAAAFRPNARGVLRVHASDARETHEAPLEGLRDRSVRPTGWFRYPAGVAWAMLEAGLPLGGADIVIASNLPSGAGLSSSAALEMAVARALVEVAGLKWDPRSVSRLAQQAEHEFAGVACGIMDQMAVACAAAGHALLLDCRSLDTRDVALPAGVRIVIINTGVRRSLAGSEYNDRRAACERAVAAVRELDPSVRALRDVDLELLDRARPDMDPIAFRRASHVVAENVRPLHLADALEADDRPRAGRIMTDSHGSLRDLYEVSCPELDTLVELSVAERGCHGARLTGAGFGGCAIALVDADRVEAFTAAVPDRYRQATRREPRVIVGEASAGVLTFSF